MNMCRYSSCNIDNQPSSIHPGRGPLVMTGKGRIPVARGRAGRDLRSQISNLKFEVPLGAGAGVITYAKRTQFSRAGGSGKYPFGKQLRGSVRLWARRSEPNRSQFRSGEERTTEDRGRTTENGDRETGGRSGGAKQSQFGGFRASSADRRKTQSQFARRGGCGVRCVSRTVATSGDSFKEG